VAFSAVEVSASIRANRDTRLELSFAEGTASCRFWTSDLGHEYIRVNADYHT
jgi:glutamate N-acetyltransferase/amino-acid N-acetyltransferase